MNEILKAIRDAQQATEHAIASALGALHDAVRATGGVEIRATAPPRSSALMMAAEHGPGDVIRILLDAGATVEAVDDEGVTALMYAARVGCNVGVDLLLERGARTDAQDKMGWTALLHAAAAGHDTVVTALGAEGAVVEHRSSNGDTALTLAQRNRHAQAILALETATTWYWQSRTFLKAWIFKRLPEDESHATEHADKALDGVKRSQRRGLLLQYMPAITDNPGWRGLLCQRGRFEILDHYDRCRGPTETLRYDPPNAVFSQPNQRTEVRQIPWLVEGLDFLSPRLREVVSAYLDAMTREEEPKTPDDWHSFSMSFNPPIASAQVQVSKATKQLRGLLFARHAPRMAEADARIIDVCLAEKSGLVTENRDTCSKMASKCGLTLEVFLEQRRAAIAAWHRAVEEAAE